MKKIHSMTMIVLAGYAVVPLGCVMEVPPDGAEDPMQDGIEAEGGGDGEPGEESVGEAQQATEPGQTVIKSAKGKCWNAYSSTVLNMATCNFSSKQSWIIDDSTGLIKSVHYWGKCAELPSSPSGKVTLKPCDQWDSYQWFYYVPLPDGQDTICGHPEDAAGNKMCASYKTDSYVYVNYEPWAPDWYRIDF